MALSAQQLQVLQEKLVEEKMRAEHTLNSLRTTDPANDPERLDDNSDVGDEAGESLELDRHEVLERQTSSVLQRIDEALARIDAGTYGVTSDGEDIPFERLMVDPTATTLVH